MLKQRIITALVLLGILAPALFYPDERVFAVAATIIMAAAVWEWVRLVGFSNQSSLISASSFGLLAGATVLFGNWQFHCQWLWGIVAVLWTAGSTLLLLGGATLWVRVPVWPKFLVGIVGLGVAWLAVIQARFVGVNFLLSILALVWVADIAAYFFGRSLGGKFFSRKLAPSISPGKTWEGALGGLVGVIALAMIWRELDLYFHASVPSVFTNLGNIGLAYLVGGVLFLGGMSVIGDLVESLFKRAAGVKDSSALLPGHGGVLDRIDALLPVLPIAMYLANA